MKKIFDIPEQVQEQPKETCRTCKHRQRWECGASIIQYCGVRKSNRTFNGLLKIKVHFKACMQYKKRIT